MPLLSLARYNNMLYHLQVVFNLQGRLRHTKIVLFFLFIIIFQKSNRNVTLSSHLALFLIYPAKLCGNRKIKQIYFSLTYHYI